MKKKLLLTLATAILIPMGCDTAATSGTVTTSGAQPTSNLSATPIELNINVTGYLFEAGFVNQSIALGETVTFNFTFKESSTQDGVVTLSHPDVIKYELVEGQHTLTGLKVGQSIIYIKNEQGLTFYRRVLRVREALTAENALDYLLSVDTWVGEFANWEVTFLDETTGIFKGLDVYDLMTGTFIECDFVFEFAGFDPIPEFYYFDVTEFNNTQSELKVYRFELSKLGDYLYATDDIGFLNILYS